MTNKKTQIKNTKEITTGHALDITRGWKDYEHLIPCMYWNEKQIPTSSHGWWKSILMYEECGKGDLKGSVKKKSKTEDADKRQNHFQKETFQQEVPKYDTQRIGGSQCQLW